LDFFWIYGHLIVFALDSSKTIDTINIKVKVIERKCKNRTIVLWKHLQASNYLP